MRKEAFCQEVFGNGETCENVSLLQAFPSGGIDARHLHFATHVDALVGHQLIFGPSKAVQGLIGLFDDLVAAYDGIQFGFVC